MDVLHQPAMSNSLYPYQPHARQPASQWEAPAARAADRPPERSLPYNAAFSRPGHNFVVDRWLASSQDELQHRPAYDGPAAAASAAAAAAALHSSIKSSPPTSHPANPPQPMYLPTMPAQIKTEPSSGRKRSLSNADQIVHYLQIPALINDSKGSLAEFAAQITCLFWFESAATLSSVEACHAPPSPTGPLVLESLPTTGFRKWVTTILSTTQVTQNVILLALLFIYRLKKSNPSVKGKAGSEYRLLTVALMLGNKFLDDNTYTNKTWAEVSGISVTEIHIMEVEFLSNMRYDLYTSEAEWLVWHRKLARFWEHFEKAFKAMPDTLSNPSIIGSINSQLALPSPPTLHKASPPFASTPPHALHGPSRLHPISLPPYMPSLQPLPLAKMPDFDLRPNPRKRSYDDSGSQEPMGKRFARGPDPFSAAAAAPSNPPSLSSNPAPRLPMPNLSISTSGHLALFNPQLPLSTNGRSMSSVYAAGPSQWPPAGTLPHLAPQHSSILTPQHSTLLTPQHSTLLTPQRSSSLTPQHSSALPPLPVHGRQQTPSQPGSRTVSPTAASFPQSHDLLTASGYPSQRNSPYRPLRGVNTLTYAPPPTSLQNPSRTIGLNNMYYQPLGRPMSERKTGVVPFLNYDTWQQLPPGSHPQWPYLPQPQPSMQQVSSMQQSAMQQSSIQQQQQQQQFPI